MMLLKDVSVDRPKRWDVPFGAEMTSDDVQRLLRIEPFCKMDASRFSSSHSLHDILLNDARIAQYRAGDIVIREGEFGESAFLILRGTARVVLQSLPSSLLGRSDRPRKGWLQSLIDQVWQPRFPEVRATLGTSSSPSLGTRDSGAGTRVFLQDVPGVLDQFGTLQLTAGSFFGELGAIARAPRSATVFVEEDAALLEIRWQGLRDIMRRDNALREHIDELYRSNSLAIHLRETPLLRVVPNEHLPSFTAATEFASYGTFEWHAAYRKVTRSGASDPIAIEPVIAEEQSYADGLILIRSGFARLSHRYGSGHRTVSYLGKGQTFGLAELVFAWKTGQRIPWQYSLRSVGYTDILRIPTNLLETFVFPHLPTDEVELILAPLESSPYRPHALGPPDGRTNQSSGPAAEIDAGLIEFLSEHRVLNGTQTMLIDLERCTRCDDCLRACAKTHDNNPRFIRQGLRYENLMIANACMHCVDPVCMIGCPTGAIARHIQSGSVVINDATCVGCTTCANSCPYNNITMVQIRDVTGKVMVDRQTQLPVLKATKCDLCHELGGKPSCQSACPHDAMLRTNLNQLELLATWLNK